MQKIFIAKIFAVISVNIHMMSSILSFCLVKAGRGFLNKLVYRFLLSLWLSTCILYAFLLCL